MVVSAETTLSSLSVTNGSETWTAYTSQESKLHNFHKRCLRCVLGITWKDKVANNEVLIKARVPSMYTLLRQRRLRWLGHVRRTTVASLKTSSKANWKKGSVWLGDRNFVIGMYAKRDLSPLLERRDVGGIDQWQKDLESRDAQRTPSWRTAHHSSHRGEKSEEEGLLRTFKNPTRGTVSSDRTAVVSVNHELDCLATANAAPNQQCADPWTLSPKDAYYYSYYSH